jgi:hypothetical protein
MPNFISEDHIERALVQKLQHLHGFDSLTRFDGNAQRIRFLMGDSGIEPTVSARKDFGDLALPWMPDRMDTLVALLCDCDVLTDTDGALGPGPSASAAK